MVTVLKIIKLKKCEGEKIKFLLIKCVLKHKRKENIFILLYAVLNALHCVPIF